MKKKILICLPSIANEDGIARVILGYYDKKILDKYEIDFLCVFNKKSQKYEKLIKEHNGEVFYIPKNNIVNRYYKTKRTISGIKKKYDIMHVNLINIYALACIDAAKKMHSKIVLHTHNPRIIGRPYMKLINDYAHFLCTKKSDYFIACSTNAGDSCFNSSYSVITNKIDVDKFEYSEYKRKKIREKYNIEENEKIIGVVARITEQKNPELIIKIFNELRKKQKNIKLLWIGDGNLKEYIIDISKKLGIYENIILVNESSKIEEYYSAMDAFVLPSKYEGLGIVFIEAQANGLRTYASKNVPNDIEVTDIIEFMNDENEKNWAKKILSNLNEQYDRKKYNKKVKKSKFYRNENNNELLEFYDKMMKGE